MKSTREKILRTLLSYPESTINDLAEAVGINGISIRHHLTNLEAEDLVMSTEERHGVGRPRLIYSLTEKGIEKFPTSYLRLSQYLIESLKNRYANKEIKQIFEDIGRNIAASYKINLDDHSTEERLSLLKKIMTKEGFVVEVSDHPDYYSLNALSCPYYKIGLSHSEVCSLDHTLVSEFFTVPVSIQSCILEGDEYCSFQIWKDLEHAE